MSTLPRAAVVALNACVDLLGSQANDRFQVIGFQRQKKAAETNIDLPLVQCWIDSADVDWDRSSRNGPKEWDIRIEIQFTIAQPAVLDIVTIQDPNSTAAQRSLALTNLMEPAKSAANYLYSAWGAVCEILDDARNENLGLPTNAISDKSYSNFQQDKLPPRGGLAVLTATSFLEFRVREAQLGDLGNEPSETTYDGTLIGTGVDEVTDDISQAGTETKQTFP
jgi:hypothetical protein